MSKQEIIELIHANEWLMDFIKGNEGHVEFTIGDVPVIVFKGGTGVELYYRLPYNSSYDYSSVVDFLKYAIPEISKEVEKYRDMNLMSEDCIKPIIK